MGYRLIALDMDGTLLNRQREISDENVKWINKAMDAGIKIVLATGRPIREVVRYGERLRIDGPLVINNGSEIWLTPDKLHARSELAPELVAGLFELLRSYGDEVDFWAHTVGGRVDRTNVPSDPAAAQWLQFAFRCRDADVLAQIRGRLTEWNAFELSNSHVTNIECNPIGISKASGLREVCALLDIGLAQAIAVGDSLNDIPMIRAAGLGVAMGNAQEPVKRAADAIAPPNHEHGVAQIIEKYLFS